MGSLERWLGLGDFGPLGDVRDWLDAGLGPALFPEEEAYVFEPSPAALQVGASAGVRFTAAPVPARRPSQYGIPTFAVPIDRERLFEPRPARRYIFRPDQVALLVGARAGFRLVTVPTTRGAHLVVSADASWERRYRPTAEEAAALDGGRLIRFEYVGNGPPASPEEEELLLLDVL